MKKGLIIGGVIILIILLLPLLFPGSYHVKRSIVIDAEKAYVFDKVSDFHNWPDWSPWLVMEDNAKVNYNGTSGQVGSKYDWAGELVGEGEMEITNIANMDRLDYDLHFTKPMKSESTVYVELNDKGDGVEVIWGMEGGMPYFMRFMNGMMDSWIGMDYDRGLSMLKDLCEDSVVLSKITYGTPHDFEGTSFVGIRHTIKFEEMGNVMADDFGALATLFEEKGWEMKGMPMSVYYSMDFKNNSTDFATAFPVALGEGSDLPEKFFIDNLPAQRVFDVTHRGKYEHTGNAWSAGMQYTRIKKLKPKMKATMWEVYTNDPGTVARPADYETVVYIPIK